MSATCGTCHSNVGSVGVLEGNATHVKRLCSECLNREGIKETRDRCALEVTSISIGMAGRDWKKMSVADTPDVIHGMLNGNDALAVFLRSIRDTQ